MPHETFVHGGKVQSLGISNQPGVGGLEGKDKNSTAELTDEALLLQGDLEKFPCAEHSPSLTIFLSVTPCRERNFDICTRQKSKSSNKCSFPFSVSQHRIPECRIAINFTVIKKWFFFLSKIENARARRSRRTTAKLILQSITNTQSLPGEDSNMGIRGRRKEASTDFQHYQKQGRITCATVSNPWFSGYQGAGIWKARPASRHLKNQYFRLVFTGQK